ncbi:DUF2975 domain-containing protein [Pontibacter ummariensis]|nr:DUF2975 domain-containing protein [Pontibacter ummariensis]
MKKNKLLNVALQCCHVIRVLLIGFMIAISFAVVHNWLSPEVYDFVKIEGMEREVSMHASTTTLFEFKVWDHVNKAGEASAPKAILLKDLSLLSFSLLYLQTMGLLTVWLLIVQRIGSVIQSVRELQTFRNRNSSLFRQIGWYCFAAFLLMAFRWADTDNDSFFGFYLHYMPLVFMLASFILSEIFEEGSRLYEEEQLTI